MSRKFRAKPKQLPQNENNAAKRTPTNAGNIGKMRILFLLVLFTGLAAGVYIAAACAAFAPVFHAYWIISAVLTCTALVLNRQNEYRYTKESVESDPEAAKAAYFARKKRVKYVILALLPFLLTVLADAIYLFLFVKD